MQSVSDDDDVFSFYRWLPGWRVEQRRNMREDVLSEKGMHSTQLINLAPS